MLRTADPPVEEHAVPHRSEWREVAPPTLTREEGVGMFFLGAACTFAATTFPVIGGAVVPMALPFGGYWWDRSRSRSDPEPRPFVRVLYRRGHRDLGNDQGRLAAGPGWLWFEGERTEFCVALPLSELRRAWEGRDAPDAFAFAAHGAKVLVSGLSVAAYDALVAEAETHDAVPIVSEVLPVETPRPPMSRREWWGAPRAWGRALLFIALLPFVMPPAWRLREADPTLAGILGAVCILVTLAVFLLLVRRHERTAPR